MEDLTREIETQNKSLKKVAYVLSRLWWRFEEAHTS